MVSTYVALSQKTPNRKLKTEGKSNVDDKGEPRWFEIVEMDGAEGICWYGMNFCALFNQHSSHWRHLWRSPAGVLAVPPSA